MTRPDLDAMLARASAVPTCELLVQNRNTRTARAQVMIDDAGDLRFVADVNENWGPYADLFAAARADIPALVAYARELEATLANDRGEGEPPVPGWEPYLHNGRVRWSRELADGVYDIVREARDAPGWIHRHRHIAGHVTGTDGHPTARAAMNAADAAIRASKVPA